MHRSARLLLLMSLLALASLVACKEEAPKAQAPAAPAAVAPAPAPAAPKMSIAVVDEDRIYEESNLGVAANALLKEANTKLQAELREFQDAKKDNATEAEAEEFRKAVGVYQDIMRAAQQQIFEQVQARVTEVLSNFRQQQGLELILSKSNVLSYGMQADVTDKVLEAVNAMPADIKGPELKESKNLFGKANATAQ